MVSIFRRTTTTVSEEREREIEWNDREDFLDLNHELEFQSTRSSVECGAPEEEFLTVENTPISHIVTVASPSSTNSSVDEYHGIDRSLLDDMQYGNWLLMSSPILTSYFV